MARRYYPIDNVEDIDVSRIGVHNIDNRYIDNEGNRYATRFNLRTHKIEIVRIALGKDEAVAAKSKDKVEIARQESKELKINSEVAEEARPVLPPWLAEFDVEPDTSIEPQSFFSSIESETTKFAERFRGIVSNAKNSEAFDKDRDTGQDFILELSSMFDREVQAKLSDVQNQAIEFVRFPKPATHYIANTTRGQKKWVESMSQDQQMQYIQGLILGNQYLSALGAGLEMIKLIRKELEDINRDSLQSDRRHYLDDLKASLDFITDNVKNEGARILGYMQKSRVI